MFKVIAPALHGEGRRLQGVGMTYWARHRWHGWMLLSLACLMVAPLAACHAKSPIHEAEAIPLATPARTGFMSVEEALANRRSRRDYTDDPITSEALMQLLWAAQGITDAASGFRTAPSAGATFPLVVYVAVGRVEGLEAGVYRYRPQPHDLERVLDEDVRPALERAAIGQLWVGNGAAVLVFAADYARTTQRYGEAPVSIVITAVYARTTAKYGERGIRYVHMEVGHAAQNVYLQAEALGLGTVAVGAFDDDAVKRITGLRETETPLYLMPVGQVR